MPIGPLTADDKKRAERRADSCIQADRVVREKTRTYRENLLSAFDAWLRDTFQLCLDELLAEGMKDPEVVSEALVAYGKELFYGGRAYGRFAETINGVAARRPTLRKQLASAWDLCYNWVADDPHEHHPALPCSLIISIVSLALLWGWPREAAIFAMTWAGLLRIGEVLQACRSDLVPPEEAAPGVRGVLLKIRLPKTRGRAARHQCAKIEYEDISQLISAVFRKLSPGDHLWHQSPSTLRKRFNQLQAALGIDFKRLSNRPPYDLASLRAGGATHLLQLCEDAELVRRKGRWISTRVLEIYLQEAEFATFPTRLSSETTNRVNSLCSSFPTILEKSIFLLNSSIPEEVWHRLW